MQQNHLFKQMEGEPKVLTFGHLSFVFFVAILLLGISWLKNPEIFKLNKSQSIAYEDQNVPRYYAYVPPLDTNAPRVAGASIIQGPSVINEDGSLSSVTDSGQVLGASTEDLNLSLDKIKVKAISTSDEAVKQYFESSTQIEAGYLDSQAMMAALQSNDQSKLDAQNMLVLKIISELSLLNVPSSLEKLHKLKILQYNSAATILKNYTNADQNPEIVNKALGIFLAAQQQLETEVNIIKQKFNLTNSDEGL